MEDKNKMKVNAGILIDFGNSETRMTLLVNNKAKTIVLSNKFAALESGYSVPVEYDNDKTNVFCVNGSYYACGALADREFSGQLIRPSSMQNKSEQLVTEISLNLVLITAIAELAKGSGLPVSEIEPTFNISVLLPPMEHDTHIEKMEELISSVKFVNSYMPLEFNSSVNISSVKVLPEGVAAFFGVYYTEEDGQLVEVLENMTFGSGNLLIIDIGAGTTDVVLIRDTELVLDSKDTFNIGGNTVEGQLKKLLRQKCGFTPSDISSVVETGELNDGNKKIDVSSLVTSSKDMYSKMLMTHIQSYLERMSISMREVKGILVVGGGSLPSMRDGKVVSPAMSDVLINYFKALSPNISLMNTEEKNPRLLNIQGLQYIHKYS